MRKRNAVLAVLVAVTLALAFLCEAVSAEELNTGRWERPGVHRYTGSPSLCMQQMLGFLTPESQKQILAQRAEVTVSLEKFSSHLAKSAVEAGLRSAILAKAARFGESGLFVENMVEIGTPEPVVQAMIAENVISREAIEKYRTVMTPGKECQFMCFTKDGYHRLVNRVKYQPLASALKDVPRAYLAPDGVGLIAYTFTAAEGDKKFRVTEPIVCNNLCLDEIGVALTLSPSPFPMKPQGARLKDGELGFREIPWITFVLGRWQPKDIALDLANVDGLQSRDLHRAIMRAAGEGKIPTAPGVWNYEMEFGDATFEHLRSRAYVATRAVDGKCVDVVDRFSDDFGKIFRSRSIKFDVCDGWGRVTLAVALDPKAVDNWAGNDAFVRFTAPDDLRYPNARFGRSIQTCAPNTDGTTRGDQCGRVRTRGEPGELIKAIYGHAPQLGRYYFYNVVK